MEDGVEKQMVFMACHAQVLTVALSMRPDMTSKSSIHRINLSRGHGIFYGGHAIDGMSNLGG